ncbi:hypothetical protein ACQP1P_22745 [Dactylosporangium sp. CA-052675]|uniref:hypothetical protein n=1 Tax=Dactylosporangium sp. CA-052675 TaxID=3239927 RepID=UPI003D94789A
MRTGLLRGALAGAAGTTALNAVTYADMALRGRAASGAPQELVARFAEDTGVSVPGDEHTRENRLQGLGPLVGAGTGVAVGALAGLLHHALARRGYRMPAALEVALIGGAAMALADVPLKVFRVSDPKTWTVKDWASDIVPHLVFGAVTLAGLRRPGTARRRRF